MQTLEVTQEQWYSLFPKKLKLPDSRRLKPIDFISLTQINKFISLLNTLEKGKVKYRLPTEAEWEYACRAGTKGPFYTGETINTNQANYNGEAKPYGNGKIGEYRYCSIVGAQFSPNPWGLYDMHGNVSEVCSDYSDMLFYTYSPIDNPVRVSMELGAPSMRGGSWRWGPFNCCSASRSSLNSPYKLGFRGAGFRLVAIISE